MPKMGTKDPIQYYRHRFEVIKKSIENLIKEIKAKFFAGLKFEDILKISKAKTKDAFVVRALNINYENEKALSPTIKETLDNLNEFYICLALLICHTAYFNYRNINNVLQRVEEMDKQTELDLSDEKELKSEYKRASKHFDSLEESIQKIGLEYFKYIEQYKNLKNALAPNGTAVVYQSPINAFGNTAANNNNNQVPVSTQGTVQSAPSLNLPFPS